MKRIPFLRDCLFLIVSLWFSNLLFSATNQLPSPAMDSLEQEAILDTTNQNVSNQYLSENPFPPPVITNYSHEEVEASLKGLGGGDTNNMGESIWDTVPEPVPMIKKPIEGWGFLELGLSFDEVVSVLSNDYPWMILRPQEDSLNPDRIFFIESFKNDFFTKVQFQFDSNQRLYLLRLELNSRYFSFLQIYNRLFESYGPPQENSYIRVMWQDETRSLELYRNQTVVYIDKKNWEKNLPRSLIEDQRQKLLNSVFDGL